MSARPLTAKQERFCMDIASGLAGVDAYLKMNPKSSRKTATESASKLQKHPKFQTRISNLREKLDSALVTGGNNAIQKAEKEYTHKFLSIAEKRAFLGDVIRTPIGDIDESSVLCQAVKYINTESGSSKEFKMVDKLKAIQLDNELAGHVTKEGPNISIQNNVNIITLTEDRRKELMDKKRSAIERRRALQLEVLNAMQKAREQGDLGTKDDRASEDHTCA